MRTEQLRRLVFVDQYVAALEEVTSLENEAKLAATFGLIFAQYPELALARQKWRDITQDLININNKRPVLLDDSFRDYLEPL